MAGLVKILDCTLRDGGLGLEDLNNNGLKTEYFTSDNRKSITENISNSGIDIIELGSIEESVCDKENFAVYKNLESLSKQIPQRKNQKQLYAGMYRGPDTDLDKIPEYSPELVEAVRVILRYSELQKSLDYCTALARKGYKVFVQPMLTMRYTNDDLDRLIYNSNEMGAFALYFVDSFGYMNEKDVDRLYYYYIERLNSEINIGFHAHNNMDWAFGNAKYIIEHLKDRNRIIDSCVIGMGQGAGNLQTEILVNYMNQNHGTKYDFNSILEVCDTLEKFRIHDMETWGYSPVRLIPAIYGVAYKYAVAMRIQYGMSLVEINNKLKKIPDDLKHRYTSNNLEKILGI